MELQTPEAVLGLMVVHAALRSEAADIVAGASRGGDRVRLARRTRLLGRVIHVHHHGEDELLWPSLSAIDPSFAAVGDGFVEEHEMLDVRIEDLVDRFRHAGRDDAVTTAADMRDALEAHLVAEERDAIPRWLALFGPDEHADFATRLQRATPLGDVAVMVSWLLDRAQGPARDMVWEQLPGALRALYRWRWKANFERTYGIARPEEAPSALRPRLVRAEA